MLKIGNEVIYKPTDERVVSLEINKIIVCAIEIRLSRSSGARIPHDAYINIEKWLLSWTPLKNLKAVIANDIGEALGRISKEFHDLNSYSKFSKNSDFEIKIGVQDMKEDSFWMAHHGTIHGTWYPLKDQ